MSKVKTHSKAVLLQCLAIRNASPDDHRAFVDTRDFITELVGDPVGGYNRISICVDNHENVIYVDAYVHNEDDSEIANDLQIQLKADLNDVKSKLDKLQEQGLIESHYNIVKDPDRTFWDVPGHRYSNRIVS